jgi:hypothetical protein
MSEVVSAVIANYRLPNSFFRLYFQLYHESYDLAFVSFVIMPLSCVITETNEIFLFGQELSLSSVLFDYTLALFGAQPIGIDRRPDLAV